ncbi:MAG: hypothetical protein JWN02_1059 [Acidobacteria bacterium]|jgi:hypothetical protein|nr:hypothetical protein [Acidobacteriota bacterium]
MTLPQVIQRNLAPFLRPPQSAALRVDQMSPLLEFVAGGRPAKKELRVKIPAQEKNNWCWAAVAVGICEAYGDPPISQCTVASKAQRFRCCSNPPDTECDSVRPLSPALSLQGYDHFLEYRLPDRMAPLLVPSAGWSYLTDHIDRGLPIPVRIAFGSGDHEYGHFVVVTGYQIEASGFYLVVRDPASDCWRFELREFISHFLSTGRWNMTYELKPPGVIAAIP